MFTSFLLWFYCCITVLCSFSCGLQPWRWRWSSEFGSLSRHSTLLWSRPRTMAPCTGGYIARPCWGTCSWPPTVHHLNTLDRCRPCRRCRRGWRWHQLCWRRDHQHAGADTPLDGCGSELPTSHVIGVVLMVLQQKLYERPRLVPLLLSALLVKITLCRKSLPVNFRGNKDAYRVARRRGSQYRMQKGPRLNVIECSYPAKEVRWLCTTSSGCDTSITWPCVEHIPWVRNDGPPIAYIGGVWQEEVTDECEGEVVIINWPWQLKLWPRSVD